MAGRPRKRGSVRQVKKEATQAAFLEAYRKVGTVSAGARVAGIDRSTHQRRVKADPKYAAAFADAHADFCELLEQEIVRRGVVGWDEPVVYQGQYQHHTDPSTGQQRQVVVRKFDSILLLARANAEMPTKYGRYRHEHAGPGGGPIPHRHAGTIVVVDGPKDKYMAGLQKAREAAVAAVGGDGHGGDGAGKPPGAGGA